MTLAELEQVFRDRGLPGYRARQLFSWIYQRRALKFGDMSSLPRDLRDTLAAAYDFAPLKLVRRQVSKDQTEKYLFSLNDGEEVETVLIPAARRTTLCVSSQAGCKYGCRFCASGVGGFSRQLSSAEILGQILGARAVQDAHPPTHVVFMGTGEPLDNYDPVLKAVRIMNDPAGLHIGARRITLSTCGLVPGIRRLAEEGLQAELSISLHGYNDEIRKILMPVNTRYPLKALIGACHEYVRKTGRQITFEYLLIRNLTCTPEGAAELGRLLKGLICKLNLIPYNPVQEFPYGPPPSGEIKAFQARLKAHGVHATIRKARGRDIMAACGQLRHCEKQARAVSGKVGHE